ncbi:MAG: peptidoglycan-binding domain-containing protein [Pseudomonadota bacterium]
MRSRLRANVTKSERAPNAAQAPRFPAPRAAAIGLGLAASLAAGTALSTLVAAPALAQSAAAMTAELPSNPEPGACYARVFVPGETRRERREIVLAEATEELRVTPARYAWVQEPVVIEEAYERIEVIPARFETQTRTVVIEPERKEYRIVPATFETVTERVKVRDATTEWRRDCAAVKTSPNKETLCGVSVPAQFRTEQRRVVRTPARRVEQIIPAVTRQIEVRAVVEQPRRRVVTVPAKTRLIRVKKEISPARVQTVTIPPKKRIEFVDVKVTEDALEWRKVLCERDARPTLVRSLQLSLDRAGFDPGPIDGVLGPATKSAVDRYQKANNLPQGGLLLETLDRLGLRS